jgi:hypothetical protein
MPLRVRTLFWYLLGGRRAILDVAANRWALPVGFLFVLSAGFAREYDGEDLWHEPWHVFLPLGASLLSSLLLFCLAYVRVDIVGAPRPEFFSAYLSFLGLFWLTAPLAWLYAVPYERFLTPPGAVQANLATLAVVSYWRVALMARVLVVLMGYRWWTAVFLVMAFADVLALISLWFLPVPIIPIMGGLRLSESEQLIQATASVVLLFGCCSLPLWWIGLFVSLVHDKPRWKARPAGWSRSGVSWTLSAVAAASMVVWTFVLPHTQREQQLRFEAERAFRARRISELLSLLSRHERDEFPPSWDPPPRFVLWESVSHATYLDTFHELKRNDLAPWVREVYREKWKQFLRAYHMMLRDEDLPRVRALFDEVPDWPQVRGELLKESPFGEMKLLDRLEERLGRPPGGQPPPANATPAGHGKP